MRFKYTIAIGAVLAALSAVAPCQAEPSKAECLLLSDIAKDSMLELRLSEIAQDKATSKDVQAFAKRIVTDSSKTSVKLTQAAKGDRITLPTELAPSQRLATTDITATPNKAFDVRYMDEMVAEHKRSAEEVAREIKTGSGNAKKWAAETLPVIETRKKDAESLAARLNAHTK
jgi:putative membrane protein